MKIVQNQKPSTVEFSSLAVGDLFEMNGKVYMRAKTFKLGDYTAYCLETAYGLNVDPSSQVVPLNGTLTVTPRKI